MKVLIEEIELFFRYMKYAVGTEKVHRNNLKLFAEFLSSYTETNIEELHLQKTFEVWHKNSCQTFLPINATIIDDFFL